MDNATLRKVFAFGIYLFFLHNALRAETLDAALANAEKRAKDAVRHADLLLKALEEGPQS